MGFSYPLVDPDVWMRTSSYSLAESDVWMRSPTTFHPKSDKTAFLGTNDAFFYQSNGGILRWAEN